MFRTLSGYDGGDCCLCTCESTLEFTCGDQSHGGFACIDPSATCVDDDGFAENPSFEDTTYFGSTTSELGCIPDYFTDGLCDLINNHEACGASRSTNFEGKTISTWLRPVKGPVPCNVPLMPTALSSVDGGVRLGAYSVCSSREIDKTLPLACGFR